MSSALCTAFSRVSSRVNLTYIKQFTSSYNRYHLNPTRTTQFARTLATATRPTLASHNKRPRIPFPKMSAITESDILARLDNLKITHEPVVEHEHCPGAAEWDIVLKGKDEWKGKSFSLSKTLLFKPKQPKSAAPTPVMVIAKDTTETSSAALGKLLNMKDLRLAQEELVKEVLPGCQGKGGLSPFLLPGPIPSTLHILVDSSISSSSDLVAFHTNSWNRTFLIPGTSVIPYLQSIQSTDSAEEPNALKNVQIREVDFSSMKKDEVAERGNAAPVASAPKGEKKKNDGKKEDAYEMAVGYTKEGDFSSWYSDVLVKGDMLDYYDVSGCYILKPWSYTVWQHIQNWFDAEIKKIGVEDCYFPMFVSASRLEKEKDHIEGFAPEVAWVTKAGQKDLEEPIAIRPTSETVMYPYYAKWIRSYRDLPLKLNQWNSVVRWEFKNPQPFLRTREFLWQEGHTAFLTQKEAGEEVLTILDLYRRVYEDLLAVPVIPGVKSEKEKFAGGLYTTTVEGYIPTTGRGIQGGTSHCLGQNFSKMFDITVQDPNGSGDKLHVWQNSWGLSTRTIGVMVMIHGDDQGLVMPPRVSSVQVVIVPVGLNAKQTEEEKNVIFDACKKMEGDLISIGVRAKADLRDGYTPGWKFNDWELRGVPIRLEIGPRDLAAKEVKAIRRVDGHKFQIANDDIKTTIPATLEEIHYLMFDKAKKAYDDHIVKVDNFDDVVPNLDAKNVLILPWCEAEACEDDIKERSAAISNKNQAVDDKAPSAGAKSLCIPHDQARFGEMPEGQKCVGCGQPAKRWTMFGRSY